MTKSEKQKLISTNAAILMVGILVSFILPFIAESMTDGRGNFLKMMAHVFPLLCTLWISSNYVSKAVGEPSD